MNFSEVSIIIPVYNSELYVERSIRSAIKNRDLIKSICQISLVSKERIIKPPQLRKKPPNKQSI